MEAILYRQKGYYVGGKKVDKRFLDGIDWMTSGLGARILWGVGIVDDRTLNRNLWQCKEISNPVGLKMKR